MPSNSGITKLCAHDKAKTVASAARIPSAKPRALTCIRAGGKVTSDASTLGTGCSTGPAESAVLLEAETAMGFMARRLAATLTGAHFCSLAAQRNRARQSVNCAVTCT